MHALVEMNRKNDELGSNGNLFKARDKKGDLSTHIYNTPTDSTYL